MSRKSECLDKLIESHWEYVHDLLVEHEASDLEIKIAKFHYKSAFKHGFKHAAETHSCE